MSEKPPVPSQETPEEKRARLRLELREKEQQEGERAGARREELEDRIAAARAKTAQERMDADKGVDEAAEALRESVGRLKDTL